MSPLSLLRFPGVDGLGTDDRARKGVAGRVDAWGEGAVDRLREGVAATGSPSLKRKPLTEPEGLGAAVGGDRRGGRGDIGHGW